MAQNDFNDAYAQMLDPDAQDDEPVKYHEGDTPPVVPGVSLPVTVTYVDPEDGHESAAEMAIFLPEPMQAGAALIVHDVLFLVGSVMLPFVTRVCVKPALPTAPGIAYPDWMRMTHLWAFHHREGA